MNEQQLAAVKQALEALQEPLGFTGSREIDAKLREAITALQSIISQDALDKMAEDARTIGLRLDDWDKIGCVNHDCAKCKAQPAPNCTRSHPHENMGAMCELRTEIARLTNENARLKAQPAPVQEPIGHILIKESGQGSWFPFLCEFSWTGDLLSKVGIGRHAVYAAAQPAPAQEGRDWSLLEATQESLREHMAEIKRLQYEVDAIPAIKEERDSLAAEVLEQSRIIAMSAEREDALRAEIKRLKAAQQGVKEG
jgi:hypothetical protein